MAHLFISAGHKSSGKTTLSIGLCRAYQLRKMKVQPFKKGPDYIDPMWLSKAADRPCQNLDFFTMEEQEILSSFGSLTKQADLSLIEGNKGLYDGLDLDGSNSNAALAKKLSAPVVLVIDARGMTRGIAPLILGYQAFDKEINIAGVILNQLGGSRHESKLRAVIEHYTDVAVLGAVHRNADLEMVERHLGLIPSNEQDKANEKINRIAAGISQQVDLDRILTLAQTATLPPFQLINQEYPVGQPLRIGVVKDAAFGFYYHGDFLALQSQGAELVFIDSLTDKQLPKIDGLFIGGGFPETHLHALSENHSLRQQIREEVSQGLPVYAECGGLMYLCRSIRWQDKNAPMVGVIPADVVMGERPQGRGYVRLRETANHPWPKHQTSVEEIMAHEFHYSRLENIDPTIQFAYEVRRGYGIDGARDGLVFGNVLACYSHLRHTQKNPWTQRFLQFVTERQKKP